MVFVVKNLIAINGLIGQLIFIIRCVRKMRFQAFPNVQNHLTNTANNIAICERIFKRFGLACPKLETHFLMDAFVAKDCKMPTVGCQIHQNAVAFAGALHFEFFEYFDGAFFDRFHAIRLDKYADFARTCPFSRFDGRHDLLLFGVGKKLFFLFLKNGKHGRLRISRISDFMLQNSARFEGNLAELTIKIY